MKCTEQILRQTIHVDFNYDFDHLPVGKVLIWQVNDIHSSLHEIFVHSTFSLQVTQFSPVRILTSKLLSKIF